MVYIPVHSHTYHIYTETKENGRRDREEGKTGKKKKGRKKGSKERGKRKWEGESKQPALGQRLNTKN